MATCIEVESYGHPGSHPPAIITQDADNRFVTDAEKAAWNAKVDQVDYDTHVHTLLRNAADTVTGISVDAAGNISLMNGVAVNEFSTDNTLSGESDAAVPTEKAIKAYVDNAFTAYVPSRLKTPNDTIMNAFVIDTAGRATFPTGVGITRFSADATLASDSDTYVPTERAVKAYVDARLSDDETLHDEVTNQAPTERAVKTYVDTKVTADIATADAANIVAAAVITDALDLRVTANEDEHDNALTQELIFGGGTTGQVATMSVVDGLITAVTLVA